MTCCECDRDATPGNPVELRGPAGCENPICEECGERWAAYVEGRKERQARIAAELLEVMAKNSARGQQMADAINNMVDQKYEMPPAEEQPATLAEINRQLQDEYQNTLDNLDSPPGA